MDCKITDKKSRLNIVLVGKTGNGKSATGNSILNRSVFKTSSYSTSCTEVCELESARLEDHVINVIDTPGLMDTSKSQEEILKIIEDAMSLCQGGFNAFILVLRCDTRYTDEELSTYNTMQKFFGADFLKVCVVAFTRGDILEMSDDPKPFNQWLEEQTGMLKALIKECNSRVVPFYNSKQAMFQEKRQAAVRHLIKMIDDNNMLYTDDNFQKAEQSRKKMTVEAKLPQLQAKYQEQLSLLQAEYDKALGNLTDDSIQSVLDQAQKTLDSINKDANGTDILDDFKDNVTREIQHINNLKYSQNREIKLQKLSEYNNLLKNPPSKARIALYAARSAGWITAAAATFGASIAVKEVPIAKHVSKILLETADYCKSKSLDSAKIAGSLILELREYNKRLEDMDKEIQELK